MSWRGAFLRQARSENEVRLLLNDPRVEYSHRLHYLQMVTEKLAKAALSNPVDPNPPRMVHGALVRLLQVAKGNRVLRTRLGYSDASVFRAFIDSMLDLASQIESLAPSSAGRYQPNAEYPWEDRKTGLIHTPVDYHFALFDPRDPKMIKFEHLLTALRRVAE